MLNLPGNYAANAEHEALTLRATKLRKTCMSCQAAGLV